MPIKEYAVLNWKYVLPALILAGVAGGLLLRWANPGPNRNALPPPTDNETPPQPATNTGLAESGRIARDDTWQIYRNTEYRFEVKHPQGWKVESYFPGRPHDPEPLDPKVFRLGTEDGYAPIEIDAFGGYSDFADFLRYFDSCMRGEVFELSYRQRTKSYREKGDEIENLQFRHQCHPRSLGRQCPPRAAMARPMRRCGVPAVTASAVECRQEIAARDCHPMVSGTFKSSRSHDGTMAEVAGCLPPHPPAKFPNENRTGICISSMPRTRNSPDPGGDGNEFQAPDADELAATGRGQQPSW